MKRFLLLALMVCMPSVLHAQVQPTTVIIVRHGEKLAQPADNPSLSAEGWSRAEQLLEVVRHAGITAVYSTPYARTLETARGVAQAFNLTVTESAIPNRSVPAYGDSVAARVRRDGGVILVVGHSNTMGAVIKSLGGPDVGEITDVEYDHLFVLTVQDGKPTRMVHGRYGGVLERVTK